MNSISKIYMSLQDYLIEKWYEHIMETLKGTQWLHYNVQGVLLWQMKALF